jgi:hypothetical protein
MRHFRCREFAPSLAVPRLPNRVQAPRAQFRPVTRRCPPNRVAPLLARAVRAESPAQVAARAEPKLHAATSAGDKPKKFRRQKAPCRRFLDMELRLWSKVHDSVRRVFGRSSRRLGVGAPGLRFFRRARSLRRPDRLGPDLGWSSVNHARHLPAGFTGFTRIALHAHTGRCSRAASTSGT